MASIDSTADVVSNLGRVAANNFVPAKIPCTRLEYEQL